MLQIFDPAIFDPAIFEAGEIEAGPPRVLFALPAPLTTFILETGAMTSPAYTAPPKDPADIEDYGLDCAPWLAGETITARTVVADDSALVISGIAVVGGAVRWRGSGGVNGRLHTMTVRVTSSTGRRAERTIALPVRDL